jgi:hypothetical protein
MGNINRLPEDTELLDKLRNNPDWPLIERYRDSIVTQAIRSHDAKLKSKALFEVEKNMDDLFDKGLFYLLYRYYDHKRRLSWRRNR